MIDAAKSWIRISTDIPWAMIAAQMLVALMGVWLLHRIVTPALLGMTTRFQFTRRLIGYADGVAAFVILLTASQTILENAPDTLAGITMARRLNTLALIGAVTWLGVRCVRAVADFIIEKNPANTVTNVQARRIQTQTRVFSHSVSALIILVGLGMAFSTLPLMRKLGTTFLASAGVAGLLLGFAAKPVLGNLLAGMQLALTQPIRLGDVVVVEQEWGWIDEITGTYVVIRIWDERRLVVPLQWFIEHPFQNWTRNQTAILGTVIIWTDYRMPVDPIRREAERICRTAPEWDHVLCVTHVTDTSERAMQLRVLVSAGDAGQSWELRCRVREGLVHFIQRDYPEYLPLVRGEVVTAEAVGSESRRASGSR